MRVHGGIASTADLGSSAHACWAFGKQDEFVEAALEFLTDGLRQGQRIAYLGSEPIAEQRERLEPLGNVGALLDRGALQLFKLDDLYRVGEPIDADAQLETFSAATDRALGDGYTGLRVAAQVTDLVAEPHTRDAHVRWESVADRFMSVKPLSALCGYDRAAVPEPLLSDLAAVHPATNVHSATLPFHLYAKSGDLALAGEIDSFSAEDLDRVLELACQPDDRVSLDLADLAFIDHHGLEVLVSHTRRLAARGCEVHHLPAPVERLSALLDLKL